MALKEYRVPELLCGLVLLSYALKFRGEASYVESKHWYGLPPNIVAAIIPLQLLAGMGSVYWLYSTRTSDRPRTGLLAASVGGEPMSEVLTSSLLLSSLLWTLTLPDPKTKEPLRAALNAATLVATATASILALAGTFEDDRVTLGRAAAAISASIIYVLVDGVAWNARSLSHHLH